MHIHNSCSAAFKKALLYRRMPSTTQQLARKMQSVFVVLILLVSNPCSRLESRIMLDYFLQEQQLSLFLHALELCNWWQNTCVSFSSCSPFPAIHLNLFKFSSFPSLLIALTQSVFNSTLFFNQYAELTFRAMQGVAMFVINK